MTTRNVECLSVKQLHPIPERTFENAMQCVLIEPVFSMAGKAQSALRGLGYNSAVVVANRAIT